MQILPSVLATVFSVLVLVQIIAVQQTPVYVLATVVFVMVLVRNIAVQQIILNAQIQLPHVAVQVVEQSLIVLHVLLIHMVYVVIQYVAAILAAKHMTTVGHAQPVKPVLVAPVLLSLLARMDMVVPPNTIAAMEMGTVPPS